LNLQIQQIKRILFIGLGGAGQRHLRIFKSLLPEEVRYTAYRTLSKTPLLAPDFVTIEGDTLENYYNLTLFESLERALDAKPDIVVIANPTALHVNTAIEAAKRGIHTFIEKPLGTDLQAVNELEVCCRERKCTCYVAYQWRFHPCFQMAKRILISGELGAIVSASFELASFVPNWHPYEDYRELYAVRSDLGGGAILTESHELDLCYQLFGLPQQLFCVGGALSDANLDVEDTASILMDYRKDVRRFPVLVSLSFMQKHTRRSWSIAGNQGYLTWNQDDNTLRHYNYTTGETQIFRPENFDHDTMFTAQAAYYLEWLQSAPRDDTGLEVGKASLIIALAAKRSLCSGSTVSVTAGGTA
jgi:predicted dehydrogenase